MGKPWRTHILLGTFLIQAMAPQALMAADTDLAQTLSQYPIEVLDQNDQEQFERIRERHGSSFVRPAACPLASKNYGDIVSKIESIRGLFKDPSCLNDKTELAQTFDDLVSTGQGVQNELNNAGVNTSTVSSQIPTEVNGVAINSIFNNLNTLFFQNSCELNDQNLLERGADFAQNFSQIGLLIPNGNGLVVAGGGLALSGILRLISKLFTKKFNFENNSERQAFIKLNCAFYDIRRDIEKSGLTEVALPEHHEDLEELKGLLKAIEAKRKANLESMKKIEETLDKEKSAFIAQTGGPLKSLEGSAAKGLEIVKEKVADQEEGQIPAETVKRQMLMELIKIKDSVLADLKAYFDMGLSPAAILDLDLRKELEKLDMSSSSEEFTKLYTMAPEKFNASYRAALLFHFERILTDIKALKSNLGSKWEKETKVGDLNIVDYRKSLAKRLEEKSKGLDEVQKELSPIQTRLGRIVGADTGFTRTDDGTENKTAILSSYDEIANQVYGKWGYEFLKYTTKTADKETEAFKDKFNQFASDHLKVEDRLYVIPTPQEKGELRVLFACQDAKPYLRRYQSADSLTQQAYDFVVTNKELFHSDHGKPAMRFVTRTRTVFERIQDHHKSSLYALKLMRGEKVPSSQKERYLGSKAKRKEFLGTVMLEVNGQKSKAQLLQNLMDAYDCNRLTNLDD